MISLQNYLFKKGSKKYQVQASFSKKLLYQIKK